MISIQFFLIYIIAYYVHEIPLNLQKKKKKKKKKKKPNWTN